MTILRQFLGNVQGPECDSFLVDAQYARQFCSRSTVQVYIATFILDGF